jgi:hypothetical protein
LHYSYVETAYQKTKDKIALLSLPEAFKSVFEFDSQVMEANQKLSKANLNFVFDYRQEIALLSDDDRSWFLELVYDERKKSINSVEEQYTRISQDFSELMEERHQSEVNKLEEDFEEFSATEKTTKKKKYQ